MTTVSMLLFLLYLLCNLSSAIAFNASLENATRPRLLDTLTNNNTQPLPVQTHHVLGVDIKVSEQIEKAWQAQKTRIYEDMDMMEKRLHEKFGELNLHIYIYTYAFLAGCMCSSSVSAILLCCVKRSKRKTSKRF